METMENKKVLVNIFVALMLVFCWTSIAAAATYTVTTYSYQGELNLIGTIPGATYYAKAGVIHCNASEQVVVDLYYSSREGEYQYSTDEGTNWIDIDNTITQWTINVPAGGTIWLRAVLSAVGDYAGIEDYHGHHILSTSPWGTADASFGEAYYFAFPPAAHYWAAGWVRNIDGYVAVVLQ
jgi:hypothetical protein